MLNLRQLSDSEAASQTRVGTISTPVFRTSVAGNLGESLEVGWDSRSEDAEDTAEHDGGNALHLPDSDDK